MLAYSRIGCPSRPRSAGGPERAVDQPGGSVGVAPDVRFGRKRPKVKKNRSKHSQN